MTGGVQEVKTVRRCVQQLTKCLTGCWTHHKQRLQGAGSLVCQTGFCPELEEEVHVRPTYTSAKRGKKDRKRKKNEQNVFCSLTCKIKITVFIIFLLTYGTLQSMVSFQTQNQANHLKGFQFQHKKFCQLILNFVEDPIISYGGFIMQICMCVHNQSNVWTSCAFLISHYIFLH